MLLTGHLSEYPLPILLEIFLQRKETGTLEVAHPIASGYFYFRGGELVDASMGKLRGIDALNFAENLLEAAFKFSPLGPAEYAQAAWSQSFAKTGGSVAEARPSLAMLRLLPFYTEAVRAFVRAAAKKAASALLSASQLFAHLRILWRPTLTSVQWGFLRMHLETVLKSLGSRAMILASQLDRVRFGYKQWVPVSAVLLVATLVVSTSPAKFHESSSLALASPSSTDWGAEFSLEKAIKNQSSLALKKIVEPALTSAGAEKKQYAETSRRASQEKDNSKRKIEPAQKSKPSPLMHVNKIPEKTETSAAGTQTVAVALRIENGRVSQAVVLSHRPGMEAFEASALRIARERRYDPRAQRNETILVKISQPQ